MKHTPSSPLVLAFSLVLPALFAVGCSSSDPSASDTPMTQTPVAPDSPPVITVLAGTDWSLMSLYGEGVADVGDPVTLSVDKAGRVSGNSSVNRYMGTVKEHGAGKVDFKMLGSTMKAGSLPAMKQERRYLELLPRVKTARIVDGKLVLDTDTQPAAAVFKRAE